MAKVDLNILTLHTNGYLKDKTEVMDVKGTQLRFILDGRIFFSEIEAIGDVATFKLVMPGFAELRQLDDTAKDKYLASLNGRFRGVSFFTDDDHDLYSFITTFVFTNTFIDDDVFGTMLTVLLQSGSDVQEELMEKNSHGLNPQGIKDSVGHNDPQKTMGMYSARQDK